MNKTPPWRKKSNLKKWNFEKSLKKHKISKFSKISKILKILKFSRFSKILRFFEFFYFSFFSSLILFSPWWSFFHPDFFLWARLCLQSARKLFRTLREVPGCAERWCFVFFLEKFTIFHDFRASGTLGQKKTHISMVSLPLKKIVAIYIYNIYTSKISIIFEIVKNYIYTSTRISAPSAPL